MISVNLLFANFFINCKELFISLSRLLMIISVGFLFTNFSLILKDVILTLFYKCLCDSVDLLECVILAMI